MADSADSGRQVRLWAVDDSSVSIAMLLVCDRVGVFVVGAG
jgi:hypothetical protein